MTGVCDDVAVSTCGDMWIPASLATLLALRFNMRWRKIKIASPLILLHLAVEGAFTPTTIHDNRLTVLALRGGGDVSGRQMLLSKKQVCDLCTSEELKKPLKRGKMKRKDSSDVLQRRILDDFYLMDFVRFQDPESPLDRISSDRNGKKGCQTFSNLADATKFLSQRDDPKNMVRGEGDLITFVIKAGQVFAREVNVNGARVFMVGSFDEFWELYLNYPHTRSECKDRVSDLLLLTGLAGTFTRLSWKTVHASCIWILSSR